jgi:predicted Zn-dependent peptidase
MIIPQAKKLVLPNGMRILKEEIPSLRSVAMGILVGVGSGDELPPQAGISHFIEHMLFKGTEKRSAYEIAHALDAVGGKMNAYTGKEMTVYYAVVLDKHIDISIDVLSDMFLHSVFDPKEMETEKAVVLEEIKMYEDTPDELIHDYFAEKILHGHPLAQPTIGHAATITAIQREDIMSYCRKFYSPQNVIISLAGDLPENIDDLLLPYFSALQGEASPSSTLVPEMKGTLSLRPKKTEQTHLCLGVRGPAQADDERYAFGIIDNILGGSMSSRLFQEVREKRGLAYSIFSHHNPFRNFGITYVYAGTSKENLRQVVDLVLEQFSKIKKEGLSKEEIEKGKEFIKGTTVLSLESTSARMSWMAKSEFYFNRVITVDEVFNKIDLVTEDDILRLANKYFREEYLTLAVIGDLDRLPFEELHC